MFHRLSIFVLCISSAMIAGCSGSVGNSAPKNLSDQTAPLITLSGPSEQLVLSGTVYEDPGARARDEMDGILTVSVSGQVNTEEIGNYKLIYEASDLSGNTARVVRRVDVIGESLLDFYMNKAERWHRPADYTNALDIFISSSDDLRRDDFEIVRQPVRIVLQGSDEKIRIDRFVFKGENKYSVQ